MGNNNIYPHLRSSARIDGTTLGDRLLRRAGVAVVAGLVVTGLAMAGSECNDGQCGKQVPDVPAVTTP